MYAPCAFVLTFSLKKKLKPLSFLRQVKRLDGEDEYYQLLSAIESVPEEEGLSGPFPNPQTAPPPAPPTISSRWAVLRPQLWLLPTAG